jgi:transcriptional regulator with XRE-family HTH domain
MNPSYLREQRKLQKVSIEVLGKKTGCSMSAISRFENGKRSLNYNVVETLFDALGFTIIPVRNDLIGKKCESSQASKE